MNKSKFRINWRYAVGEFLIVVIGILVAFQLDSWKEERDEAKLVNEYLTDIKVGLQSDSTYYNKALEYFDDLDKDIEQTRDYILAGQLNLPEDGQKSLRSLTDWYRIYISNTAFEDLNNSGRLNLIENKNLRYNLIAYYQYISFVKILDEEYNSSLSLMKERLLSNMKFYNPEELIIPEKDIDLVLNYLDQKQAFINSYLGHRNICDQINTAIVQSIDQSLEE